MHEVPRDILAGFAPTTATALIEALDACGFDAAGYRDMHKDLTTRGMSADEAWVHYFRHGCKEGRRFPARAGMDSYGPLIRLPVADPEARRTVLWRFLENRQIMAGDAVDWNVDVAGSAAALFAAGALPYVIVGDSHSHCYGKTVIHAGRLLVPIHMLCLGGSAQGLNNPRSRSGYGPAVLDFVRRQGRDAAQSEVRFFFKFGQVDAEFVSTFHRRTERQTAFRLADFEAFARSSVNRYEAFLGKVLREFPFPDRIKVLGVFPPALADAVWRAGYVTAHIGFLETGEDGETLAAEIKQLEIPDLLTRTRMHGLYNGLLQIMCARLGVTFVDDCAPLLSGNGVVDRAWTGDHEGRNHHLSPDALLPITGMLISRHAQPGVMGASPYQG